MSEKEKSPPRNYFRLEYPTEVRPQIYIDDDVYPVINLCEGGVKFSRVKGTQNQELDVGGDADLKARIIFHDSDESTVIGRVIRTDRDAIVLKLSEGISFQKIMAEQRFLLNKYGTLRRPLDDR